MMCHSAAMALKNKFLFVDLVFTGKYFNRVHFHSILPMRISLPVEQLHGVTPLGGGLKRSTAV
jgi:hypothetical protein